METCKTIEQKWDALTNDANCRAMYSEVFLLQLFTKMCDRYVADKNYRKFVDNLFFTLGSESAVLLLGRRIGVELVPEQIAKFNVWWKAFRRKSSTRKAVRKETKERLYRSQNGMCAICGRPLDNKWLTEQADHKVPFKYVGDELGDGNLQLCHSKCNKQKLAQADYVFRKMLFEI